MSFATPPAPRLRRESRPALVTRVSVVSSDAGANTGAGGRVRSVASLDDSPFQAAIRRRDIAEAQRALQDRSPQQQLECALRTNTVR